MRFRVIVFVLIATVMGAGVSAQDLQPLTFLLTFVPNVQFSPTYVAIEKGYFADVGLDVTIEHLDEPVVVDLIAAGQRQFGMVSGEEVIKARAKGRPIVYTYAWFHRYPVGIVAPEGTGIESVADLAGRKVGIPGRFGASYNGLITLLAANGLTEDDIQLEPIGFNAPENFCKGIVEASVVYINNEPLQIQTRADMGDCGDVKQVQVFPVADVSALVSNGIVTSEAVLADNPELVRRVITAYDRGLRDAILYPAEAYTIATKYVENLPLPPVLAQLALWEQTVIGGMTAAPPPTVVGDRLNALLGTAEPASEEMTPRARAAQYREALPEVLIDLAEPVELLQFRVLLSTIALWDADVLGQTTLEAWQATQDILLQTGQLEAPIALEAAFTNAFIPGE